ncbi:MAG: CotH kinase family protein [Bacteroidales bacterium]|nr:CotH kinase family protein [Bacteroidales bacterium]
MTALKNNFLILVFVCLTAFNSVFSQQIIINEFMASNSTTIADEDGDFEDWIEIYNPSTSNVNLSGYGLTDDIANPFRWTFPAVTIAPGEYLLVWASGKDRRLPGEPLHTNFSISNEGEPLLLSKNDGMLINYIPPTSLVADVSYGRFPDGSPDWYYFQESTPGQSNSTQTFDQILTRPEFSHTGGFYYEGFELNLSAIESGSEIFFTLDGSEPDMHNTGGTIYTYKNIYPQHPDDPFGEFLTGAYKSFSYDQSPIQIYDRSEEADSMTHKASSFFNFPYYFPDDPVYKGIVVRARSYRPGSIPSPVRTEVYFINPLGRERFSLPVINISTNAGNYFDYYDGIYNPGIDFDTWRQNYPDDNATGGKPANYHRRGDEWEFPAHFTFFDGGNSFPNLSQDIGFRIHGGWSRSFPMKSLRIYARGQYGASELNYSFFPEQPFNAYRRIILRNSGNEWNFSLFRDALIQRVIRHLHFETLAYRPSVLFVNGEYWGIHNIRERYDKHYLERVFGVNPNKIDYLEFNAVAKEGDNIHYLETLQYIENNDITQNEHFEYLLTRIDTENYIDYQIANIYAVNTDWPGNNIDYWRKRTNTYIPNSPYGHDGRWRWLAFDMDFGFGFIHGTPSSNHNTLSFATEAGNNDWPNPDWSTFLLRNLLENETFRLQFINRFADLLNTAFLPDRINNLITEFQERNQPEMPEHIHRWKNPESMNAWNFEINRMRYFVNTRPDRQRNHILDYFGLEESVPVTVHVSDPEQGFIKVNSIDIISETPGILENPYPWTGIYFQGVPITIQAIGLDGFEFSHWEGTSQQTEIITGDPSEFEMVTAYFKPKEGNGGGEEPEYRDLIHYWYFTTSLPNDQPLEIIEPYFSLVEEANLTFHSALEGYPFQPGNYFWRKASLERRNAPTEINYRTEGNNYLPYNQETMRGVQVKQPFTGNAGENSLIFHTPSTGYEHLFFRFAAKDQYAADHIIVDYSINSDQTIWTTHGLENNILQLTHEYQLFTVDLTNIIETYNNPDLKIRLRFDCTDPSMDEGYMVTFNNFSLEGEPFTTHITEYDYSNSALNVFPNPITKGDVLFLGEFMDVSLFDLRGRLIFFRPNTDRIATQGLNPGTYFVKNQAGQVAKVILLP